MLSASLAQEIAGHTSEIVGLNVVLTDEHGIIIGSGDADRLGTFHEASVEVVRTGRPAAHDAEQARGLSGVRPGITLPLMLEDEVVGTVGITGSPARVRRFGLLVQSHTEIMLRESSLITHRLVREKAVTDLLREVVEFDPAVVDPALLAQGARELGYDPEIRRVAVVVQLTAVPATYGSGLLRTIRSVFVDQQDVAGLLGQGRFVVLARVPVEGMPVVLERCRTLLSLLTEQHGAGAEIGVGDPALGPSMVRESYEDALAASRFGGPGVARIGEHRTRQLIGSLGVAARDRFVRSVLAGLTGERDWPVLRDTVIAWCENGFQLVAAAKTLNVHRNTLVYRLRKLERLTGRPQTDHTFAVALYLGCLIDSMPG